MTGHVLYTEKDFSKRATFDEPCELERLVCEGGLAICKVCGKGEIQLDENPVCPGLSKPKRIYLIGSLRNPKVPETAAALRQTGHDVYDDWYAAGPEADDYWQRYEKARGRGMDAALHDGLASHYTFSADKEQLDRADVGVLLMPAGKSGHLELGYIIGRGKPGYVLFLDGEPERWDVMYRFANRVFFNLGDLVGELGK